LGRAAQAGVRQRTLEQLPVLLAPPAPLQAVFRSFGRRPLEAEIAAEQAQIGTNRGRVVEQALRRVGIGAEGRLAGAVDAGLFEADGFAVRPQPVGMVEGNPGDDGNIGFIGVDRVKAAAEADFEHCHLDPGGGEDFPGGQGAELEVGQGLRPAVGTGAQPRGFDPGKGGAQRGVVNRPAIDTDPLVIGEQMRRGVATDFIATLFEDVFQIGAGRALAVGAADDDHRAVLLLPERVLDPADTVQPQLDPGLPLGVQAFEVGQPVGERLHRLAQAASGRFCS